MKKIFFVGLFLLLFLATSNFCYAQIFINEIMYDPEGADTGREWIEIVNTGSEAVDINGWKLFEAETNHKINFVNENGNFLIPSGSFAILVDNPEKFSNDHPNFSGIIFDSAFSLSNSGETLSIKDKDLNDISSVSYELKDEAKNNGNSIQNIDGIWKPASPTPGSANLDVGRLSSDFVVFEEEKISTKKEYPVEPQIFASAGKGRRVIVGADTLFEGQALGLEKQPLKDARYLWNFGDGQIGEGKIILHNYQYPAKYVVILNVSSGEFSASDRIIVDASPADLIISSVNSVTGLLSNYVELYNKSKYELDISFWRLRAEGKYFNFPKDTVILSDSKLIFSSKITGLDKMENSKVELLYPNGEVAYVYGNLEGNNLVSIKSEGTLDEIKTESVAIPVAKDEGLVLQDEENVVESIDNKDDNLVASVNSVGGSYFNKWIFALGVLVFASVATVIFIRKRANEDDNNMSEIDELSDEIEIIQ